MPFFTSGTDSGKRKANNQLSLLNTRLAATENLMASISESERAFELDLKMLILMMQELYGNLDGTFYETIKDMQSVDSIFLYIMLPQNARTLKLERDYAREINIEYADLLDTFKDTLDSLSKGLLQF
jgi:hypothetical protein